MQIELNIAANIISSNMYGICASIQRTNFQIMSLLTGDTPGRSETNINYSAMLTAMQPMRNSCRAMFTEESICFNIFPIL
jgi:hypothetical protein